VGPQDRGITRIGTVLRQLAIHLNRNAQSRTNIIRNRRSHEHISYDLDQEAKYAVSKENVENPSISSNNMTRTYLLHC
jgi:hypothetical protein